MNEALTALVSPDQPVAQGNTYTVVLQASDLDAGRRALSRLLQRLDTDARIAGALREYEWRVASNQPYEDLVGADELRARYGA